jgi:hypothetical protein
MATIIQEQASRGDLRRNAIGNALGGLIEKGAEGYQNRADEMALQKAIGGLGKDASPQDVLNAITGTHTYRPEAKQQVFKNYLGAKEFEQKQSQVTEAKALREAKEKEAKDKADAKLLNDKAIADEKKRVNDARLAQKDREIDIRNKAVDKSRKDVQHSSNIKAAIQTVQDMENIGNRGNLGRGSGILKEFGGDTAKDYAQYEQLGKSLIQVSTNIPIRNRQEFETLAHNLFDPSLPDQARQGVLDAMKSILNRSLIEIEKDSIEQINKAESITPEGKIKVRDKATGKVGSIIPSAGWESKYERI